MSLRNVLAISAAALFVIKVAMVVAAVRWSMLMASGNRRGPPPWVVLIVVLLCARPLISDLQHGNVNIIIMFLVIGGQLADCAAAYALLERMPATSILHGDKGYDSNANRRTKPWERHLTSRLRSTGAGRTAPRPSPVATATPSSACSDALRTSAESQPDTIARTEASSSPSVSWLPSATGYEPGA